MVWQLVVDGLAEKGAQRHVAEEQLLPSANEDVLFVPEAPALHEAAQGLEPAGRDKGSEERLPLGGRADFPFQAGQSIC